MSLFERLMVVAAAGVAGAVMIEAFVMELAVWKLEHPPKDEAAAQESGPTRTPVTWGRRKKISCSQVARS